MPLKGLTLGKFAPLHRGHQRLIELGIAETDAMVVIIYDSPRVTSIPLTVRARWIRELYPSVEVIEAWDGPEEVGYTEGVMRAHERYVIDTLGVRGVTHFYSGEPYGAHMSQALGALDRRVDPERLDNPISGTIIRSDPFAHRPFLAPAVYRDHVANLVFLGAPSTGKTTLAQRLAEKFETVWMPEFGREYWEAHQVERRLTGGQLVEIAEGHVQREDALLLEANQFLFTDTNAMTTEVFAHFYHGGAEARLIELSRLAASRYDLFFLCGTDVPYEDSDDRSGEGSRSVFQKRIIADLVERRIPYIKLTGDVGQRVAQVTKTLRGFHKFADRAEFFSRVAP